MTWWVPIAVALITGPLVALMARFDKRNTEQHDRNMDELRRIGDSVDEVGHKVERLDSRLDDHVAWHAHSERRDSA